MRIAHARNGPSAVRVLQRLVPSGGIRSYAAEEGREGTAGDELSGDPNRAPQKQGERGESKEGKEGNDHIKKGHQEEASDEQVEKAGKEQQQDREDMGTPNFPNKK